MEDRTEFEPSRGTWVAAAIAIAAAWFQVSIFAGQALISRVQDLAESEPQRRLALAVLVAGGLAGSGCGAWRFRLERYPRMVATAFRAAGLAAALTLLPGTAGWMMAATGLAGFSLGWLTVVLTAGLRATVGTARLGRCVGLGIGLAYALGNVPWIFEAGPQVQTIMAALLMGVGALAGMALVPQEPSVSLAGEYRPRAMLGWAAVLLVLGWMSTAAGEIIRHTPALREAMWAGWGTLWGNAAIHLVAAVLAGLALDRGRLAPVAAVAYGSIALACVGLNEGWRACTESGGLYIAGVSAYSALMVYYPARSGRAGVAGAIFALAGWLGAGMGRGMAEPASRMSLVFLGVAGAIVAGALAWRRERGTE